MSDKALLRKDAPPESTWSGREIFPTWDDWQKEYDLVEKMIPGAAEFAGKLMSSFDNLVEWMEITNEINLRSGRLMMFARFAVTVDATDVDAKAMMGLANGQRARYAAAISYGIPEVLEEPEKLREWGETVPALKQYAHFFDNMIRQQAHLRSAEVEEILNMLIEPFGSVNQVFSELVNNDLEFEDAVDEHGTHYTIKQSTLMTSLQSSDRERRRTAWEHYFDSYLSMKNTLATNYITWVKQQIFMANVRGYDSVLQMRLDPFNVPLEMFHNLINTFQKNIPTWHRYWDVKRRALGLDQIRPYDIWAPIGSNPPVVPYVQAVNWICESLEPMGEEYVSIIRRGALEEGWVDWAPNIEKRQGAASWRRYLMPPWIFMSYNDSVFSLSTLAHELGHSIHTYLASENQPEVNFGFGSLSSTVAETASNFHQVMARAYLRDVKGDDPDFMVAMAEEAMSNFHRYFFIMPTLARFEYEVFSRAEAGKPLTVNVLDEIMRGLFAEGYGQTLTDDPDRTGMTWATFLHLYMPFYTFQYAIGISAAHGVGEKILTGDQHPVGQQDVGQQDVGNYIEFLKAGGSLYTMDLFKLAGVDMSSPDPVNSAFRVMEENINLIEKLAIA